MIKNTLSIQIKKFYIEVKNREQNTTLTLQDRQKCISVIETLSPFSMFYVSIKNTLSIQMKKQNMKRHIHAKSYKLGKNVFR